MQTPSDSNLLGPSCSSYAPDSKHVLVHAVTATCVQSNDYLGEIDKNDDHSTAIGSSRIHKKLNTFVTVCMSKDPKY